ncbi:putative carotenoid cleavage dioxygenase 4, chloroplastic [Vitis vinifera]|uniref:Putative carotenoid cleavage dioxygenase 4, chloroplastic n=1 Tax=Vitis vinifera TaxID=29760 RepID=A0A438H2Q9_VITVI|nr:putative carotenoid cleavage dioxygenase 4, chloroplastic [Vitis vinifera]
MMFKGMPVSAEIDKVPRIGVLPRSASTDSKIRWFEAPGFNAMHAINAWEEGDEEIILVAPQCHIHREPRSQHRKGPFLIRKGEMIPKMSGVVKIDLELVCEVSRRLYGAGCFGGEPLFVAKDGASEEDDGYIVSYVHDEKSGASRFVVMDAKSQTLDVVATVKLPRRVPYGFHGLFVKDGDIREIY